MEFNNVLEARKSIRKYEPCEISESELKEMVKAAGMAPSSDNVQNWHFAAINDREIIRTIGRIAREKWQKAFDIYKDKDPEKGEKFEKFASHFFFFFEDADALILVFAGDIDNRVNDILTATGEDISVLYELNIKRNNGLMNIGAAIENLLLKAVDMGYGACWMTAANYAAPEITAYLKDEHGFDPEGKYMVSVIPIGKKTETAGSPVKKPIDEVFTMI